MASQKKILVTGAAGFLGSHLSEKLSALGHEVIGIDNMIGGYEDNVPGNIKFQKVDCCDFQELCKIVQTVRTNYPTMGGVSVWEFCDSPPRLTSYSEIWAYLMTCLLSPHIKISVPSSCNLI